MKQHISPNQLEQVDRFDLAEYFPNSSFGYWERKNYYQFHCKKMTIGKMIEIISQKYAYEIDITYDFEVKLYTSDLYLDTVATYQINNNLCDALWEAVKFLLEVEK